jgi:hypothetical protein
MDAELVACAVRGSECLQAWSHQTDVHLAFGLIKDAGEIAGCLCFIYRVGKIRGDAAFTTWLTTITAIWLATVQQPEPQVVEVCSR